MSIYANSVNCSSFICLNGGKCNDKSICICAPGFSGPLCEFADIIINAEVLRVAIGCNKGDEFACLNNGDCFLNGSCSCLPGYWGERCADYVGCAAGGSLACQNNGGCGNNGKCICTEDFRGNQCEISVRMILCSLTGIERCLNGKCALNGKCICDNGWTGDRCEKFIGCNDNGCKICHNSGSCLANGTCVCPFGYSGYNCANYIGCKAQGNLACKNGASCGLNGLCECKNGYTGLTCSDGCNLGGYYACQNGGTCGSNNLCICREGFIGSTCGHFVGCKDERVCSLCVNGECRDDGICLCTPGYSGTWCTNYVGNNFMVDTTILTTSEINMFRSYVGLRTMTLIYRASRDGFQASSFHIKANGISNTVTFIKSTSNYVFGGYTAASWDSTNSYKIDTSAYIFTMRRAGLSSFQIYSLRYSSSQNYAIYCGASYGPTFGGGHDIHVCDRSNAVYGSYTNTPSYYNGPSTSYLAGVSNANWLTSEIEVFRIA